MSSIISSFYDEYGSDSTQARQHLNSVKTLSHLMRVSSLLQLKGEPPEIVAETLELAQAHIKNQAALVCEGLDMTGDVRSTWEFAFYCGHIAEAFANDWQSNGPRALTIDYCTPLCVLASANIGDGLPPVWYQSPHAASLQATLTSAVGRVMAAHKVFSLFHEDANEVSKQVAYSMVENCKKIAGNINANHGVGDRHEAALMQLFLKCSGYLLATEWTAESFGTLRKLKAQPEASRGQIQKPVDLAPLFERYRTQIFELADSSAEALRFSKKSSLEFSNV